MIGKTRQLSEVSPARGVLRPEGLPEEGRVQHTRNAPPADLEPWIAHYWSVRWDFEGLEPFAVGTVPHPNVHLVFEAGAATISGVHTSKFSKMLEGKSWALGVKFKPGGFRPFYGHAVAKLANQTIDARQVFGDTVAELFADPEAVNAFLRSRLPEPDESATLAGAIVDQILKDATIRTVDELARHSSLGKRSLQRLFSEYVGASPKWVIRRYRLHEALERIHAGTLEDMASLAVDLGYYDQAHLIEDFKSIVGLTPGQYQALVTRSAPAPTSLRAPGP